MGKSEINIDSSINERAGAVVNEEVVKEHKLEIEAKDAQIQEYLLTIDELRSEILVFEKKTEEEA